MPRPDTRGEGLLAFQTKRKKLKECVAWRRPSNGPLPNQFLVLDDFTARWLNAQSIGRLKVIKLALRSRYILVVNWPRDIASSAVQHGQSSVLEWYDLHRDELPPQGLDCAEHLSEAAARNAVGVLKWWHARRLPASKFDWQQACAAAIAYDALQVQLWLREHPDLFAPELDLERDEFEAKCIFIHHQPAPFTLDFIGALVPDLEPEPETPLPEEAYSSMATLLWWCSLNHVTVSSLLPLDPAVTREIKALVRSKEGNVPYTPPSLPSV